MLEVMLAAASYLKIRTWHPSVPTVGAQMNAPVGVNSAQTRPSFAWVAFRIGLGNQTLELELSSFLLYVSFTADKSNDLPWLQFDLGVSWRDLHALSALQVDRQES